MPRPIRFNAFSMNAASHQSPGLWRHPRNTSMDFNRLDYWTDLARLLERGLFDALVGSQQHRKKRRRTGGDAA